MDVQFAVAKVGKYAVSESGDTLEMIERPFGGLSLVLADGQRSGKSAKAISNVVVRKAIQLLGEGVRDGAAARAAHDYLYLYRKGKVSATLNILSIDAETRTLVISRNNEASVLMHTEENGVYELDELSFRVGVRRKTKPVITELPLAIGTVAVAYTDGLRNAGSLRESETYNPFRTFTIMMNNGVRDAQMIADKLLEDAYERDNGRPKDDISVVVVSVIEDEDTRGIRRLHGSLAI